MGTLTGQPRTPALRWIGVLLRGLHLVAIIGLGAALLGAPLDDRTQALAVLTSGAALMALDLWVKPHLVWEWSGAAQFLKLAGVVWMAFDASVRLPLFWLVVVWSAIFAHAPARFRHASWSRRGTAV